MPTHGLHDAPRRLPIAQTTCVHCLLKVHLRLARVLHRGERAVSVQASHIQPARGMHQQLPNAMELPQCSVSIKHRDSEAPLFSALLTRRASHETTRRSSPTKLAFSSLNGFDHTKVWSTSLKKHEKLSSIISSVHSVRTSTWHQPIHNLRSQPNQLLRLGQQIQARHLHQRHPRLLRTNIRKPASSRSKQARNKATQYRG